MKKIKFKYKDLPKLLNQIVIVGRDGYLRLPFKREKPKYAFGSLGYAFALFDIETGMVIL